MELLLADLRGCSIKRVPSVRLERALTALFYRMAALLFGLRAEPQPEYRC